MCGNIDRNELACRLIQSVRGAFENRDLNNMKWSDMTRSLFSELDCLAECLGADVRHKQIEEEKQNWEFLYDVCFFVTGGRDPQGYFTRQTPLKQALLVLECEWNQDNKEMLYDFSKLLLARSKLRAFVFYTDSSEKFDSTLEAVKALIDAFEQGAKSDRYLICGIGCRSLRFALVDGRGEELCRKNY
ncbi:hypothetical protein F4Y93_04905 [Candidatus Poribacteria bacterium]|nr:hypothetical protein [Candidatus Poribacteria bacterium]